MNIPLDFVPSNFDAAVAVVAASFDHNELDDIRKYQDAKTASIVGHHGGGRWIRNNWSLWDPQPTPLREDVRKRTGGLVHADDVSGLILHAACAHVRGEEFNLDEAASAYKDHWESVGCNFDGSKKDASDA